MRHSSQSEALNLKMLSFDARGTRRTRVDDTTELKNSAQTPFVHTFKQLLGKNPAVFEWEVALNRMPAIKLKWESLFSGVATVHINLGDAPGCVAVLLGDDDRRGKEAIIDGLEAKLANGEGATFFPAFKAIRAAGERPLIAVLRFAAVDDEVKLNVINGILRSLALAYFLPPAADSPDALLPASA